MRKILSVMVLIAVSVALHAQRDVTRFLGIPVDGSKAEMIRRLEAKGYRYNEGLDWLEGEYDGRKVFLHVQTARGKVWRVAFAEAEPSDDAQIRRRFNDLCRRFATDGKHVSASLSEYVLPEDEDLNNQITVNKKRYQAVYYQADSVSLAQVSQSSGKLSEKERARLSKRCAERIVWFRINRQNYGDYRIMMYYENKCNEAAGGKDGD